jgi:hypothetical protein
MRAWKLLPLAACLSCHAAPTPMNPEPRSIDYEPVEVAPAAVEVIRSPDAAAAPPAAVAPPAATLADAPGAAAASRCEIKGRPLKVGRLVGAAQRDLTLDAQGRVYIPDDLSVRRYLVSDTEAGCTLTPDPSYGVGGAVKVPFPVENVSALADGRVLACGWSECGLIEGKKVLPACDAPLGRRRRIAEEPEDLGPERRVEPRGSLSLTSGEEVGAGITRMRTLLGVEIKGSDCTVEAHWIGDDFAYSAVARFGNRYVTAGRNAMNESKVYVYEPKVGRVAEFVSEEPPSENALCWVDKIVACGEGLCLLDTQCQRIAVMTKEAGLVRTLRLPELLGAKGKLFPMSIAVAGPHAHFLLVHEQVAEGSKPLIYRVKNLPGTGR